MTTEEVAYLVLGNNSERPYELKSCCMSKLLLTGMNDV